MPPLSAVVVKKPLSLANCVGAGNRALCRVNGGIDAEGVYADLGEIGVEHLLSAQTIGHRQRGLELVPDSGAGQ